MPQLIVDVDATSLVLPDSCEQVLPGLQWGRHDVLFTPAYWKVQAWIDRQRCLDTTFRLGQTLADEVAACLLGGHGIPAEIGLAAFRHIRDRGLLSNSRSPTISQFAAALSEPIQVGARSVKYRFPQIRAKYIADALAHIRTTKPADDSDTAFRDWLLQTNGVGPKTASWITRNWLGSTQVAIIDIHLYRAGLITGFFDSTENVTSHYWSLERRFLNFSNAVAVNPAHLDAIIWRQMKNCGKFACRMLPTNLGKPVAGGKLQKVA